MSVESARDGDFDPEHWWEKRKSVKEFLGEFVGMVAAMWELRNQGETGSKAVGMDKTSLRGVDQNNTRSAQKSSLALYRI